MFSGYAGEDPVGSSTELRNALQRYAVVVSQWARRAAASMLADVMRRDEAAWADVAKTMSRALRSEIRSAPTGEAMRALLEDQVALITSLPLEAAQHCARFGLVGEHSRWCARADELAKEILKTGQVTASRAALIARTETSRASSVLLQARATSYSGEWKVISGELWLKFLDVRPLHRKLNGQFFKWSDPPVSGGKGERAHAGQIYNCRCWAEPVVPEESAVAA